MNKIPFTVSARAARLIGQENFSNAEGAVIELVKNSYDADATVCIVIVDMLKDAIFIIDNGEGMTLDVIKNKWMIIGTDSKKEDYKTTKSRVKTGAKGIGRFALDRLGASCEMITKTKEDSEGTRWLVNWSEFDVKGRSIGQVNAQFESLDDYTFEESLKEEFKNFQTSKEFLQNWKLNEGTVIKITGLRDDWFEQNINSLHSNLEMLVPPIENNLFELWLFDRENSNDYGKVESARCDDYDYKLSARVDEEKNVNIKLYRNELSLNGLMELGFFKKTKLDKNLYGKDKFESEFIEFNLKLEQLIPGYKEMDDSNNLEKIGPFDFKFFFMKRGGGQEKRNEGSGKYPYKPINYRDRVSWLNKFGGIKIYRDNFRVRPYGETKSSSFDWLDLGKRALSNPTVTRPGYRVRPQQIYGVVNISRIDNINFEDKSSREGLQENDVFSVFKEILLQIINKFENDRNQILMSLYKIYKEDNKREAAKEKADEVISEEDKNEGESSSDANNKETFKEAYKAIKEELSETRDEQKLLKVLASAGLIVTSFAHELKNLSDRIVPRTDDLKEILDDLINKDKLLDLEEYNNPIVMLGDMRSQDLRLKHWLDFALAAVRKNKRTRRKIEMVAYIDNLQRMWSSLLKRRQIELVIDKSNFLEVYFSGHEIDLDGIFNNLIANSVDAFRRNDANDDRKVSLGFEFDIKTGINVTYEDTGPGLSEDIIDPNQIFEPFFTTKRDKQTGEKTGTGLGMWIVKSTLDEYEGDIIFVRSRPGFKIKIVLPNG
ncbi:sensor histidine kinase [Flagellimonas sp. W118]|uniref:sensor histidine kinase n=1 Tax=Flagellimonas sp. W118 TaxID=3410791 RepID=UPI003BF5D4CC